MFEFIALYFLIGILATICFELAINQFEIDIITNSDRLFAIILWPLWALIFIVSFVTTVITNFTKKS